MVMNSKLVMLEETLECATVMLKLMVSNYNRANVCVYVYICVCVCVCVSDRFNLLNGTRDRYEIRHTGTLGKYKTKLVNTFFDLVTSGHTWSQVTIIALL